MIVYNIQTNGESSQLVIELINDSVYVEPDAVAYIVGKIDLVGKIKGIKDKLTSHLIGQRHYKPSYKGSGKIYLKASYGTFHKFNIKDQENIILQPEYFRACRSSVEVKPKFTTGKFISGLPLLQTVVSGHGNMMAVFPGPIKEIKLENDVFTAFASDVVAYSSKLKVKKTSAGKSKNTSMKCAGTQVTVFSGTGIIYFVPQRNKECRVISKK